MQWKATNELTVVIKTNVYGADWSPTWLAFVALICSLRTETVHAI